VIHLSSDELAGVFPAYLEVSKTGLIKACGPSLQRHMEADLCGKAFTEEFCVVRPAAASLPELASGRAAVLVRHRKKSELTLRGVVLSLEQGFLLLLSHTPDLSDDAKPIKYRYSDFSPCDGSQDIFLAAQVRKGLLEDAHALAQQLNKEKIAAESANVAKASFLACMSHEIRTPLNGILGMSEVLLKMEMPEAQKDLLKVIEESGNALLCLLNDILDLAKIDSGHMDIVETDFTLDELIGGIDTVYRLKCEEKGLRFELRTETASMQRVYIGDAYRIRQILTNLVSNAVKFTDCGSVIVTICEIAEGAPALEFTVTDTGIGIGEETGAKLFAPFVQADSSITRRYGGTGLGLSICKRLCAMMNGQIDVSSEEGFGSTFRFVIPVRHQKRNEISAGQSRAG